MENILKPCPNCGQNVSNIATICPNCKYDFLHPTFPKTSVSSSKMQLKTNKNIMSLVKDISKMLGNFLISHSNYRYDMDSLDGINAIPIPAKNYNSGDWTKDCIYYVLQRKATEHKRNGHMDLAIACLRKSNELSDYEDKPLLMQKDYFRLVKYLEYDGQTELAAIETEKIYRRHPEFLDKRISNLQRIKKEIAKNHKFKNDLVFVTTNNSCPICSPYNRKIFSISGNSKIYPILPEEISKEGGFCPDCIIGMCCNFE